MAVRLRKALDTAKEYKACKPEVDDILRYWGHEFGQPCPYNPHEVPISPDQTKTLLVPEQQTTNYESRAAIFDTTSRRDGSAKEKSRSLYITHMPKKGVVLKDSPVVNEDAAVFQIRLALLAASQKADGGEGPQQQAVENGPQTTDNTEEPNAENESKPTAPQRLKSLVRGTRTTLMQMKEQKSSEKLGGADLGTIAVTRASHAKPAEKAPGNSEQSPCPDLKALALFVAPDQNHDPEAARRPNTPHPSRRGVREATSGKGALYVPRKKFSLKTPPPPFKYKEKMLLRAKSKIKSRTLSKIPSIAETEESEHLESGAGSQHLLTFKVGDTVEARYRGRQAWLPGKITRCLVNGTYDISYLECDEKGVSVEYIRHKTLDVRRVKAKLRISGMLATALRTEGEDVEPVAASQKPVRKRSIYLPEKPKKEVTVEEPKKKTLSRHSSYVETMEFEPEPAPVVTLDGKKAWKGALAKGLLATSVPVGGLQGDGPDVTAKQRETRRSHVNQDADEKKKLIEALAEEEKRKDEEKENNEKSRLWTEMRRLVTKYQCEIKAKDIAVTKLLGRGKFAAVHVGKLRVHDVPHPSVTDVTEVNHETTADDPWTLELDVGIKATQFKNALPLPAEFSHQVVTRRKRTWTEEDYSDDDFEEDDLDIEHLPSSRIILEYMREVRTLSILKHENIVGIHGVLLRPRLSVVLQLMEGKNLYQHMKDIEWQVRERI